MGIKIFNLQHSWFFIQCNFSRWLKLQLKLLLNLLTLLSLQILSTYNNQYPRPLATLLSLQRCPEGILPSYLLLCPSESANDQRLGKLLLWISAAESPDDDEIPLRAVRQAKKFAVDFRRRISARP